MPGGGGDPAAQSLATQMEDFHPGRSPKPGSLDRHLAGQAQRLALPHRDNCTVGVLWGALVSCLGVLARTVAAAFPTCVSVDGRAGGEPGAAVQTTDHMRAASCLAE